MKNFNFNDAIAPVVLKRCKYELDCGWCDKFDRKCNKYISIRGGELENGRVCRSNETEKKNV